MHYEGRGGRICCTGCGVQVPFARIREGNHFPHNDDCLEKNISRTDCRSEDGVTVGLIDSIMTTARVLAGRNLNRHAVDEALKDLRQDSDVLRLLGVGGV